MVFFLKGLFLFKCWELPHRKQFWQFLEMWRFWQFLEITSVGTPPSSRLSAPHRPRELLRSQDWFRRFSRCLSSSDKWFTSLMTASTKSFVSSRLITVTFDVCSFLLRLPNAELVPELFQFPFFCRRFAFWDLTLTEYSWLLLGILSEPDGL